MGLGRVGWDVHVHWHLPTKNIRKWHASENIGLWLGWCEVGYNGSLALATKDNAYVGVGQYFPLHACACDLSQRFRVHMRSKVGVYVVWPDQIGSTSFPCQPLNFGCQGVAGYFFCFNCHVRFVCPKMFRIIVRQSTTLPRYPSFGYVTRILDITRPLSPYDQENKTFIFYRMPNSEVFAGKVWWLDSLVFYKDAFRQAHKWFVLVSLNFGITEYIWYVKVRELFCKTRHILVEFVIVLLETVMVSSKLSMLGWTVSGFDRNNNRLMMEMVLISQLSFRWKFAVFQRIIVWRRAATAVATLLGCDPHLVSVATPLSCLQCNWHGYKYIYIYK